MNEQELLASMKAQLAVEEERLERLRLAIACLEPQARPAGALEGSWAKREPARVNGKSAAKFRPSEAVLGKVEEWAEGRAEITAADAAAELPWSRTTINAALVTLREEQRLRVARRTSTGGVVYAKMP